MPRQFLFPLALSALCISLAACHGGGGTGGLIPPVAQGNHGLHTQSVSNPYSSAVLADAPTAYYHLDDTGTTAADSSGNGYNGAVGSSVTEGAAGLLSGNTDTAMSFPGTKSAAGVVKVSANAALQPSSAVTMELWLRFATAPALYTSPLAYGIDSGSSPASYGFWFNGSKIVAQFRLSSGVVNVTSPSSLAANTSYYVAGTYDGTTARLYVNGTQVASVSQTGTITGYSSAYGLAIGDDAGYSDPAFNGTVDEVAVYAGKALTATSIQNHYSAASQTGTPAPPPTPTPTPAPPPPANQYASIVLNDGATAYYRLDDTGTTAADSSANAINGTVGSSVTKSVAGLLSGTTDTAMAFPGTGSAAGVVAVSQNTKLQPSSAVSLEGWLRFPATPALYASPMAYGIDSGSYPAPYGFWFNGSKIVAQFVLSTGVVNVTSPSGLAANTTYYVAETYDGSTARLYVNGSQVASVAKSGTLTGYRSGYGFAIGDDAGYSDPAFKGTIDEVAIYAGKALTATQIQNHYSAGSGGTATPPTPSPKPAYIDWSTFGDNLQRTNYNPKETTLSASNAAALKLVWQKNLGSAITDQPVIATNVSVSGTPTTVAYIGTEGGAFYALNADTGATIWSKSLGTVASGCMDLPGGTFGITGTPTYDKATNRVYVADGKAQVHALDMSTGTEAAGWPVTVTNQFTANHIYGALSFNPNNGLLYAETGSYCDSGSWQGEIAAINTSSASISATFYPASPYTGAGIWGDGGASVDPSTNNVYVATGNDYGPNEYSAYGDQVVALTSNLSVIAANYPGLTGTDVDFGATPMLYQAGSCPQQVSAKNKSGVYFTYSSASISNGPTQSISMAPATSTGQFIGTTAYSPVQNMVYVGDPVGNTTYTHGLIALAVQSNCSLSMAWQQTNGPSSVGDDNDSATVANGVVYFTNGVGKEAFAYNASTGAPLWNSGSLIGGPVMVAPTVDGRLFVSSWDHNLYAFGL